MEQNAQHTLADDHVRVRRYEPRQRTTAESLDHLAPDSKGALTAYSLERVMGYGVDYADAVEFRAMVLAGQGWKDAALVLADRCVGYARSTRATEVTYLRRAAALLRISQTMMFTDTEERAEIYARATQFYLRAGELDGHYEHLVIETPDGPICGWLHSAGADARGSAIVLGGVEGWAQDFSTIGDALAARGIDAVMLDAPGQGETRFAHQHYLSTSWRSALGAVLDHLQGREPDQPIGIVGNSMGGSLAMAMANADPRIVACVNSSGPFAPWLAPQESPVFKKMMTMANAHSTEQTVEIFSTVTPVTPGVNSSYGLLLLQGQEDPQINDDIAALCWDQSPTQDKEMVKFSDGDHCIYRHISDRDIVMADWLSDRLMRATAVVS